MTFSQGVSISTQDHYFAQIPDYPEQVTPITTLARMVEGLGYRYYWASADLRPEDLSYKPSDDGKSTLETLEHIHALSNALKLAVLGQTIMRPKEKPVMDYLQYRTESLSNLKVVSETLRAQPGVDIESIQISFERAGTINTFPFWNLINGQLTDAIYHTGQIVAFRRASGNPMNGKVNVFLGKNRE